MNSHSLRAALESLDETASDDFRSTLRVQLLTQLDQVTTPASLGTTTFDLLDGDGLAGDPVELPVTTSWPHRGSRGRFVLGTAAAIAVIAVLTAVLVNRKPDSATVDTGRDPEVARAALIQPDQLGPKWAVQAAYTAFTSRVAAQVAATVPACAPYVDYAFDSPRRNAVTAERKFFNPINTTMYQWVYVFPTKDDATRVMDKVAESAFRPCFTAFYEASVPVQDPNYKVTVTLADTPVLRSHGDRQVVFATAQKFEGPGLDGPRTLTTVNAYIQVGRAIVYIDPIRDVHDDLNSPMERAMTAAVNVLTAALAAP